MPNKLNLEDKIAISQRQKPCTAYPNSHRMRDVVNRNAWDFKILLRVECVGERDEIVNGRLINVRSHTATFVNTLLK